MFAVRVRILGTLPAIYMLNKVLEGRYTPIRRKVGEPAYARRLADALPVRRRHEI